jgi:hypothetical protein
MNRRSRFCAKIKINEPIVIGNFLCYSKLNYFGQLYPKITCEEAVQALKRRESPAKPFATLLFGIRGVTFRFVGVMNWLVGRIDFKNSEKS